MTEISDSLRLFFETSVEDRGDEYAISVPKALVENGSIAAGDTYRVALLAADHAASTDDAPRAETTDAPSESGSDRDSTSDSASSGSGSTGGSSGRRSQRPPVEEGEVRSVTIDTLGDKGDGIAKVERGFIVIVSDTQPGDQVDVEITDVKDTVAFAEPVSEPTVR